MLANREPDAFPQPPKPVCTRSVAMLYASPFCHLDPGRGPTPIPQIAFEKEWGALVQAHDDAAAALQDRPSATLLARPLTFSALERLISPDENSGEMPAVLHLSAHGLEDAL